MSETTRVALVAQADGEELVNASTEEYHAHLTGRIAAVLRLIAAAPEYQLT